MNAAYVKSMAQSVLKAGVLGSGVILALLIFFLDFRVLGSEVTFTLLYLVPIVLVTWFVGLKSGCFISFLSIACWYIVQLFQHHRSPLMFSLSMDTLSKLGMYVLIVVLIHTLKRSYELERTYARIDYLTGSINRKGFQEILDREILRGQRSSKTLALVYIDLDNFKSLNDVFGHKAGDDALRLVADVVSSHIRRSDYFARLGGDEFALLLPDTGRREAEKIIRKISGLFEKQAGKKGFGVSMSIGAGVFCCGKYNSERMMECADGLMYTVKKRGKKGLEISEFR